MHKRDESYFQQRASEEMVLAGKAQHPQAILAHQQLAAFFLRAAGGPRLAAGAPASVSLDMGEASREQGFRLNGCR